MKKLLLIAAMLVSTITVSGFGLPVTNRQAAVSNAVDAMDNLAPRVDQIQSETNVSPEIPPEPVKPLTFVWLSAIYILFPALAIFLNRKVAFLKKVDPLILCYAIGIIIGNIKILPEGIFKFQDMFASVVIPLALPLIFFSIDIRKWFKHAKKTFLASVLQILSITITVIAIYFIFRKPLSAQGYDAGMLSSLYAGVYTGGTINMAAIKTALQIPPDVYVLVQASDVVISSLFILFSITIAQRLFNKILPPYEKSDKTTGNKETGEADFGTYEGIFKKDILLPLLKAFGLSLLIFAAGISLTFVLPQQWGTIAAILAISTLGVLASLIPSVRNIKKTFQFGEYLVLVFCVVVGSMSNFKQLLSGAPLVMICTVVAVFGSLLINLIFAKIFKIDTDTFIVVANAGINSPPMIPMIAAGLKNKEVVVTGVIAGIIGWIIGNYLGIGLSLLFGAIH